MAPARDAIVPPRHDTQEPARRDNNGEDRRDVTSAKLHGKLSARLAVPDTTGGTAAYTSCPPASALIRLCWRQRLGDGRGCHSPLVPQGDALLHQTTALCGLELGEHLLEPCLLFSVMCDDHT